MQAVADLIAQKKRKLITIGPLIGHMISLLSKYSVS